MQRENEVNPVKIVVYLICKVICLNRSRRGRRDGYRTHFLIRDSNLSHRVESVLVSPPSGRTFSSFYIQAKIFAGIGIAHGCFQDLVYNVDEIQPFVLANFKAVRHSIQIYLHLPFL